MRVALIGMRRAGKSTVGRILAESWGIPFVDTDSEIERSTGRTCADILSRDGESAFRRVEKAVLRQCLGALRRGVVATGGGVPEDLESAGRLQSFGIVIYLQADLGTLVRRLQLDPSPASRPLLVPGRPEDEVRRLWLRRDPLYRRIARHVVSAEGSPQQVAARVQAAVAAAGVRVDDGADPVDAASDPRPSGPSDPAVS